MKHLLDALEQLAPTELAGDWDNVGLLLDPGTVEEPRKLFLTIDLTEQTLDEAIDVGADFIIAYHPPLFVPFKRLTQANAKERIILKAAAAGLPIYSPHTALDNVAGGINDWLADGLGPGDRDAVDCETSAGRLVRFETKQPLDEVVTRIRTYLGLDAVRLARANGWVESVAICAGAGGSVIGEADADLLWTGEMSHHGVLAANARGASVVLCEHTNTERGYLPVLAKKLRNKLLLALSEGGTNEKVPEIVISEFDRDPLSVQGA